MVKEADQKWAVGMSYLCNASQTVIVNCVPLPRSLPDVKTVKFLIRFVPQGVAIETQFATVSTATKCLAYAFGILISSCA